MGAKEQAQVSKQSIWGLNAANFFQAEMVGVVLPVLNVFLKESRWRYDSIGLATAVAGMGTLLCQMPAGFLIDKFRQRRLLFAIMAVVTGLCFAVIPAIPGSPLWVDSLLFVSGVAQSFFVPLLGALALALVGRKHLNRTMGTNQGWNHAGNIVSALVAMALVAALGAKSVFYAVGCSSLLAATSVLLIREQELDERLATGLSKDDKQPSAWRALLRDRAVFSLFIAIFLFHFANAPILPTVALYVNKLGGSDSLTTATVVTAQVVMVPVALLAGRLCDTWGKKPVMAIAFWVLPLRILSYTSAKAVVWLQCLDGLGAGIYGVAVVAFAADFTRGKGHFNALLGLFATALATGAVVGPLLTGFLTQHLGFEGTFRCFAALAVVGALWLTSFVPETNSGGEAAVKPVREAA